MAFMNVSPSGHFIHKALMPEIKGFQLALPPQNFRVAGIAFFVFCQYAPYGVELSVLSEQVAAAELLWRYIPDSHRRDITFSDVVPQHELCGMGVEIMLPRKISLVVFPDIVLDQGNGDYQGYEPFVIIFYHPKQFLLFAG